MTDGSSIAFKSHKITRNGNHDALRKIVADYLMLSNRINNNRLRSGIYTRVLLVFILFRF